MNFFTRKGQDNSQILTLLYISNKPELLQIQAEFLRNLKKISKSKIIYACPYNFTHDLKTKNVEIVGENILCALDRLKLALKKVNTKFVKVCADDDIFDEEVVSESIEELQADCELASCQGHSLAVNFESKKGILESHRPSYEETKVSLRICEMLIHYGHFTYSVYKTSNLQKAVDSLLAVTDGIIGGNLWELGLAMLTIIAGKSKVLNKVFLYREPTPSLSWYNDLILENQSHNINALLNYVFDFLLEKKDFSNVLQSKQDLHLWFQFYLLHDCTGMEQRHLDYLENKRKTFYKKQTVFPLSNEIILTMNKIKNTKNALQTIQKK